MDRYVTHATFSLERRYPVPAARVFAAWADPAAARLVLTEQGTFLDGREEPAWRERGTGDWLDALGRALAGQSDG